MSVLVSLLAEPMSKSGTRRSDADHLAIELVLHLLRNILSADPLIRGERIDVHVLWHDLDSQERFKGRHLGTVHSSTTS